MPLDCALHCLAQESYNSFLLTIGSNTVSIYSIPNGLLQIFDSSDFADELHFFLLFLKRNAEIFYTAVCVLRCVEASCRHFVFLITWGK